ncbi:hypothetical protein [Streptomyces sp. OE57]|uniref:hypothetical protein n=1 Tax=Streptomyces lacaronensis TaxID=3379885 RepID=UPI0039B72574
MCLRRWPSRSRTHDIIATGRSTDRPADLAERGVQVRRADVTDATGLTGALGS